MKLKTGQRDPLDEEAASAPQQRGREHKQECETWLFRLRLLSDRPLFERNVIGVRTQDVPLQSGRDVMDNSEPTTTAQSTELRTRIIPDPLSALVLSWAVALPADELACRLH